MRPASATRRRRLSAQRRKHQLKHASSYAPSPGSAYMPSDGGGFDENKTAYGAHPRPCVKRHRRSASATGMRGKKSAELSARLQGVYGGSIENNGSLSSRRRENDKREALLYESADCGDATSHEMEFILEQHRASGGGRSARSAGPKMRKARLPRSNSMEVSPMKDGPRKNFRF